MCRPRRYIEANKPYELDMRVKSGLPFAWYKCISLLIESAIARTQRDDKVKISHYLWQANHVHILIIPQDAEMCVYFYQEVQKKVTEYMKRLLGVDKLDLWEGDPILAQILDVEKVIDRIAYYYANPAEADLVDNIDEYPGLSSWNDFLQAALDVDAKVNHKVPWVRLPSIIPLSSCKPSNEEDVNLYNKLIEDNKIIHDLDIYPFAWLKSFNITDKEAVKEIKERIIKRVREIESTVRLRREREKKSVLGVKKLLEQPIMAPHTPPPREFRIYVLATKAEDRIAYIKNNRTYFKICKQIYQDIKNARPHKPWPPGAIRPHFRPIANAIRDIGVIVAAYNRVEELNDIRQINYNT